MMTDMNEKVNATKKRDKIGVALNVAIVLLVIAVGYLAVTRINFPSIKMPWSSEKSVNSQDCASASSSKSCSSGKLLVIESDLDTKDMDKIVKKFGPVWTYERTVLDLDGFEKLEFKTTNIAHGLRKLREIAPGILYIDSKNPWGYKLVKIEVSYERNSSNDEYELDLVDIWWESEKGYQSFNLIMQGPFAGPASCFVGKKETDLSGRYVVPLDAENGGSHYIFPVGDNEKYLAVEEFVKYLRTYNGGKYCPLIQCEGIKLWRVKNKI